MDAFLAAQDTEAIVRRDPVELVRRYEDPRDQEVAGMIVASLAYGRVASIRDFASKVLAKLGPSPSASVRLRKSSALMGLTYRFQRGDDLPRFVDGLGSMIERHGSLAAAFLSHDTGSGDYASTLGGFLEELRASLEPPSYGLRFLVPTASGSAAKRSWLFLRWMIRPRGPIDLGSWQQLVPGAFQTSRLLVPLDTHVERIARYVGLTDRRTRDLEMAREVTASLRALRPDDPVAYDVALCHLGVAGSCPRRRDPVRCEGCPIRPICRLGPDADSHS